MAEPAAKRRKTNTFSRTFGRDKEVIGDDTDDEEELPKKVKLQSPPSSQSTT